MKIEAPEKELDENEFYILHVEDEDYSYKEPVERCLGAYGFSKANIRWTFARNAKEALAALEEMDLCAQGRGFDAILCDLSIPADSKDRRKDTSTFENHADPEELLILRQFAAPEDINNGLAVAKAARRYGWPTVIIGLTNWSEDKVVLQMKRQEPDGISDLTIDSPVFDEFLNKTDMQGEGSVGEVKLKHWLIPTANFVVRARNWTPPAFFGISMWSILRALVQIARQDVIGWPLPKILLLGETGCGKGMLASTYYQLLKEMDKMKSQDIRRPGDRLHVVNCASLVPEGEGGRIQLFGFYATEKNSRNMTVPVKPGVFEMASEYNKQKDRGFAPNGAEPDYAASGVVFLDEFVTLADELQAAVLNALEEGMVRRQDGTEVKIGCHVVFATNADVTELVKGVRADLLDRIPYVIKVPPLQKRTEEVFDLITAFADDRLRKCRAAISAPPPKTFATITDSARQIIERALELKLVTSIRQLQAIAAVQDGETKISDGNCSWLLQKARLLGIPAAAFGSSEEDLTPAVKAKMLQLPNELQNNSLPSATEQAIHFLYKLYRGQWEDPNKAFPINKENNRARCCFYLLLTLIPEKAENLTKKSGVAIRQARSRCTQGLGIDTEDEEQVIAYLLNPTEAKINPT
jgi:transcriptional regulator with AAA-type ATPase domain